MFQWLLVAPIVGLFRRLTNPSPPSQLQESLADDFRAAGLLSVPKSPGSFDHVAAIVIRNCRGRLSISQNQARGLIEDAATEATAGGLSGAGLTLSTELLTWRVNHSRLG